MSAPQGHAYCSVCKHPLDWYEAEGAPGRWVHPLPVHLEAKHEPVVVETEHYDPEVIGHCDFCNEIDPRFEYPCRDFELGRLSSPVTLGGMTLDAQLSDGAWAACDECARLIDASDVEGLARRSARNMPPGIEQYLVALYERFMLFRTGKGVALW
jgi:hypothetical protein